MEFSLALPELIDLSPSVPVRIFLGVLVVTSFRASKDAVKDDFLLGRGRASGFLDGSGRGNANGLRPGVLDAPVVPDVPVLAPLLLGATLGRR